MRLDVTDLAVLIKNTERVALRLVDDTNCLLTINVVNLSAATKVKCIDLLELYEVVKLVVPDSIGAGADFRCLAKIFREDGNLKGK